MAWSAPVRRDLCRFAGVRARVPKRSGSTRTREVAHGADVRAPMRTQPRTLTSMAKIVPVREFRTKLSELLSDVADRRDHVLVTRNGKPAAALVPIDEYEALEETAEILSDQATLAAIEAGLADLARGDTVTLDDVRGELRDRRAAR